MVLAPCCRQVAEIATLKQKNRTLRKEVERLRDAEQLARRQQTMIESLQQKLRRWEKEGKELLDRQKSLHLECEQSRHDAEGAVVSSRGVTGACSAIPQGSGARCLQAGMEEARKELGDAPKQIEHLQRLVIKRDDKIKDLEDEAQTLRMILKGRVQTGAAAQSTAQVGPADAAAATARARQELAAQATAMAS